MHHGQSLTSLQKSRRKKKKKHHSNDVQSIAEPCFVVIIGIIVVIGLWSLGATIIVSLDSFVAAPEHYSRSTTTAKTVNLWPDSRKYNNFDTILASCLPNDEDKNCRAITNNDNNNDPIKIGILRPPGIFGNIFELFIIQFIQEKIIKEHDLNIELIKTSHIDTAIVENTYSAIIRIAVLPPILEIIDLILQTRDKKTDSLQSEPIISNNVIQDLALQWTRWHCRIGNIVETNNIATLSIPFDRLITYPAEIQQDLYNFFNVPYIKEERNKIEQNMEKFAEMVFKRIDECTEYINKITYDETIIQNIDDVVSNEIDSGICHTNPMLLSSSSLSRTTEIIGYFFDQDPKASKQICTKYPTAQLCVVMNNKKIQEI